tara:strand:+ start:1994 stop:2647 length:654 start_codon:yes stop_codon:yes gene_type:complete
MHNLIKFLFLIFLVNSNFIIADNIFERSQKGVVLIAGDQGYGSGVIISETGYVLTNYHVINNNSNLSIALNYEYNLDEYKDFIHEVKIIKSDPQRDLALLKIINPRTFLHPIKISKKLPRIGSKVHAIGHPDLMVWSYTSGYVNQYMEDYEWSYDETSTKKANVYLTQTPIAEGNSGGPLLNDFGNLIGINTFGDSEYQFHNFAITVEEILHFLTTK